MDDLTGAEHARRPAGPAAEQLETHGGERYCAFDRRLVMSTQNRLPLNVHAKVLDMFYIPLTLLTFL
jgi:hypothetical protein